MTHASQELALRRARLLCTLFSLLQHGLGPLPLDDPPKLSANVSHHLEQPPVRLECLVHKELQDGDDLVLDQYRKAEAGLDASGGSRPPYRGRRGLWQHTQPHASAPFYGPARGA